MTIDAPPGATLASSLAPGFCRLLAGPGDDDDDDEDEMPIGDPPDDDGGDPDDDEDDDGEDPLQLSRRRG